MTYYWHEENVLNIDKPRTLISAPEKLTLNDIMTMLFVVENKSLLIEHEFEKSDVKKFFKELFMQIRQRGYSLESLRVNDQPRQDWQYRQLKLKKSQSLNRISLAISTSNQNDNSLKFNLKSIPDTGPLYLIAKISRGVSNFCKESVSAFRFAVGNTKPTITRSISRNYNIDTELVCERSSTPIEYDDTEDMKFLDDL